MFMGIEFEIYIGPEARQNCIINMSQVFSIEKNHGTPEFTNFVMSNGHVLTITETYESIKYKLAPRQQVIR